MADDPFGLDLPAPTSGPDLTDPYIRARLKLPPLPPVTSAGEQATKEGVASQHPASAAKTLNAGADGRANPALVGGQISGSNQGQVAGIATVGAGAPIIPATQTQGSSAATSANDDKTAVKPVKATQSTISGFGELISKDNILKDLSNVTYSFSWYIMSKEQYVKIPYITG